MAKKMRRFHALYRAGKIDREIGAALKVSLPTICSCRIALGLPPVGVTPGPAPGFKRPPQPKAERFKLKCISCHKKFMSEDKARNRVCGRCKNTGAWKSGGDLSLGLMA